MRDNAMMNIKIGNSIIIENATQQIRDYARTKLVLDNPDFYKKEHLGKWTGNTPRNIYLYETMGNTLNLPFGCLQDIWALYPHKEAYRLAIRPRRACQYESSINLYPYQQKAVEEALRAKNGVLVMPCGAGKTQCGLEVIARVGGKALWLTHTQDLLNQSLTRARNVLDIEGKYGTITGGKVQIGSHITFATIQTMCKIDLEKYAGCWDIIIVDECQRCAGSPTRVTQFYKVLSRLMARYKIGLTATPKRADGLEESMFALLGNIIHEVSREEVKDTTCEVKVLTFPTGYQPDYDAVLLGDGTLNYTAAVDDLIHNKERKEFVSNVINNLDGTTLVLASRVAYLEELQKDYNGSSICLSSLGVSKKARQERKDALKKLNASEIDCIFATYQLAKEGLDVPNLRYVVFATPEKDETTIIQSVGRVGRKAEGKEFGTVIDFMDDFTMYKSWYQKRKRYYKKIDAKIC